METTVFDVLRTANTGNELLEALDYIALDEAQGWEALQETVKAGY